MVNNMYEEHKYGTIFPRGKNKIRVVSPERETVGARLEVMESHEHLKPKVFTSKEEAYHPKIAPHEHGIVKRLKEKHWW